MKIFRRLTYILSCLTLVSVTIHADEQSVLQEEVRSWRSANEQAIVDDFVELLSIPNFALDSQNIRRNASHLVAMFEKRGFSTQLLESDGPPAVFAERRTEGATRTILIYIHYDGQPANGPTWASDPFKPVMRTGMVEEGGEQVPIQAPFNPEWRLFGRSTGDDKAPVIALLAAIDALDSLGKPLGVNLKVFLEGEEEVGSPHLQDVLIANRELLQADLWLFCDGPMHQSRRMQLVYGVRGTFGVDITVFGAARPLHSGHYGNWAPNPIVELMALLRTMRDESGNILVEGFSDEVIPPSVTELNSIAAAPSVDDLLLSQLALSEPETDERVEMAIMRPAMNMRGIRSGDVGDRARNAIQVTATASVGFRLVPAQTPAHIREAVENHIRELGYHIVYSPPDYLQRREHAKIVELNWPDNGYPSYRASMDLPIAQEVASILDNLKDDPLIQLPTMGGSLPIYLIAQELDVPVLILPVANHDNNQHGKDENIRLQNLWDAIEIYSAVLTSL